MKTILGVGLLAFVVGFAQAAENNGSVESDMVNAVGGKGTATFSMNFSGSAKTEGNFASQGMMQDFFSGGGEEKPYYYYQPTK